MFQIEDYVIYKKNVCKIIEIKKRHFNDLDYYVLSSIEDPSLTIQIPINTSFIRKPKSLEEVEKIIKQIPSIPIIDKNEKNLENEYKILLNSEDIIDLIKIIKTTYIRNQERLENKKKISDKDNYYFEKAEKYLYNEFSIVLNRTYEDTKQYIIERVLEINNV